MTVKIKRLFIGVSISDALVDDLTDAKAKLEDKVMGKWVRPENIHLTLKFIGNRSSLEVSDIVELIKKSVAGVKTFNLRTTEVGCFPSSKRARILWLGLEDDERLLGIKRKIEARASALGLEEDGREYHPHLTLARLNNKRVDITDINKRIVITRELPVERVTLFESKLSKGGAEYHLLENIRLLS